jgi:cell cycle checkpoint control protein RAD9A
MPEVLKYPVHTSVAADKRDFEEILIEDNMHIAINLKDFKSVVAHAETANATVTARYTQPCKPLQLAYDFEGVNAEFTIMTRGEVEGETAPTSSRVGMPQLSQRQTPAPISVSRMDAPRGMTPSTQMPPPPPRSRSIRPLNGSSSQERLAPTAASDRPSASSVSIDYDSLFVPADDDRQWDEMDEQEEPQDILGWDASGRQVCGSSGSVKGWRLMESRIRLSRLSKKRSLISPRWLIRVVDLRRTKWAFRQHSACHRYGVPLELVGSN